MTSDPAAPSDPESVAPPVNRKAIYSAACGFAAFAVLWVFTFGAFVLGVPAVTAGIHSRREIKLGHDSERGDNLAVAGITAGAMTLVLAVFTVLTP